ncbi:MAG: hypothetical protein AAAC47_05885 [Pararhizobium sp.]
MKLAIAFSVLVARVKDALKRSRTESGMSSSHHRQPAAAVIVSALVVDFASFLSVCQYGMFSVISILIITSGFAG